MIRAVIDTNIVVSALFWRGLPMSILDGARSNRYQLVTSDALIDELRDVTSRAKFAERLTALDTTVEAFLQSNYYSVVETVEPEYVEAVVASDPDDDAVIACALAGQANYIVTGDQHLLALGTYKNIKIITASEFLDISSHQSQE